MNIVLLDGNTKELDTYGKLCRVIGEKNNYIMNIKGYSNTEQFLFEMQDGMFMHTTDIIIIDPETVGSKPIARTLRKMGYKGIILYLTGSRDFDIANQAVEAKASGILPKDKDPDTIAQLTGKVKDALEEAGSIQRETMLLRNKDECIRLSLRDIYYFAYFEHAITAYHSGGKFEFRTTMEELEEKLTGYGFLRLDKAHLARISYIMNVQNDYTVVMQNGDVLPVSRRRYPQLKEVTPHLLIAHENIPEIIETKVISEK